MLRRNGRWRKGRVRASGGDVFPWAGLAAGQESSSLLLERRVLSSCRSVIGVVCRCLRAPPSGRPAPL